MRPRIVALAVLTACTAALAAGVQSAGAATVATCLLGSGTTTYSPGLTNTTRTTTVHVHEVFSGCVSLSHPTATSGTVDATLTRDASCTALLGGGNAVYTINWNDGTSTTFNATEPTERVQGQVVVLGTGAVTSGLYAGSAVTHDKVLTGDLTACDTPQGLTSLTATIALAFAL